MGFVPSEKVNQIFIHYWFSFFQKTLEEQAPQLAQKNINLQILRRLKVIVPPIELQNEFVKFVKNAIVEVSNTRQTLDELDNKRIEILTSYLN